MKETVQPTLTTKNIKPDSRSPLDVTGKQKQEATEQQADEETNSSDGRTDSEWEVPGQDSDPGVETPNRSNEVDVPSRRWL